VAIRQAAFNLAYTKKYFDCLNDQIIYFPSCTKLILSALLIEEATKYYYEDDDDFPAEYSKAIRSVVFQEQEAKKKEQEEKGNSTEKDPNPIDDEEFMEKLAMDWEEAL
jgi:hypothetical protein